MPYCPECGSEYREGYTECSKCGVSLVDNLPDDFIEPVVPKGSFWSNLGQLWSGFERGRLERAENEVRIKLLVIVLFFSLASLLVISFSYYGYLLASGLRGEALLRRLSNIVSYPATLLMRNYPFLVLLAFIIALLSAGRRDRILGLIMFISVLYSAILVLSLFISNFEYVYGAADEIRLRSSYLILNVEYPAYIIIGITSAFVSAKMRREMRAKENVVG